MCESGITWKFNSDYIIHAKVLSVLAKRPLLCDQLDAEMLSKMLGLARCSHWRCAWRRRIWRLSHNKVADERRVPSWSHVCVSFTASPSPPPPCHITWLELGSELGRNTHSCRRLKSNQLCRAAWSSLDRYIPPPFQVDPAHTHKLVCLICTGSWTSPICIQSACV